MVPIVNMLVELEWDEGMVMGMTRGEQGVHFDLLGGQDEGMGDGGHILSAWAMLAAGRIRSEFVRPYGFRMARPERYVARKVCCRWEVMSWARASKPAGLSSARMEKTGLYISARVDDS